MFLEKTCFDQATYQETVKHPRLSVHAKDSWLLKSVNYSRNNAPSYIFDWFQPWHCVLSSLHPGVYEDT